MIISEEDKRRFLNMVCPEYRKAAEDFIDEKIDALCVRLDWFGECYQSDAVKPGQIYIAVYEGAITSVPKVILLNVDLNSITCDDIGLILQVTHRYGSRAEYYLLIESDKDIKIRSAIMRAYINDRESCSVIMKKKCQKIYESLSDSDKLLLELGEDLL